MIIFGFLPQIPETRAVAVPLTREAYALDLRQFAAWCRQHQVWLFGARRSDIECFARDLESRAARVPQ